MSTAIDGDPMTWPRISVVMPTFQRRVVVCDALCALDEVDYPGWHEVIVVIDGSDDGTREAIEALPLKRRPRVIFHQNQGPARSRNRGASEAVGEIVLFLDDDMMSRSDILVAHALAHQAGADVVLGDIPLDARSPQGFLSAGVGAWAEERRVRLEESGIIETGDLLGGHISVRKTLFDDVGGFDVRFTQGGAYGNEDIDFGVRLLEKGKVRFCANAVAYQRYVVKAAHNLRQFYEAGEADVLFAIKHPALASEVFRPHQPTRLRVRALIRPLAAVPGLHRGLGVVAVFAAEKLWGFVPAVDRFVERLFSQVREIAYWAGVRRAQKNLE